MNIFYLDEDPKQCAQWHCDKHCVKMILETAQLLSTAHWETGGKGPYRSTHKNHPCAVWARESLANYNWLVQLGKELCLEYTARYGRSHKTMGPLGWLLFNKPRIPDVGFTEPPQCMPCQYKCDDTVIAYRSYYMGDKASICTWKRNRPEWF